MIPRLLPAPTIRNAATAEPFTDGREPRPPDHLNAAADLDAPPPSVRKHPHPTRRGWNIRLQVSKQRIIETLAELANGEFVQKPGCLPPEVRAASLLLPAVDERFRGNPATAQQVQINVGI